MRALAPVAHRTNDAFVAVHLGIRYTARMPAKKRLPHTSDRDIMLRAIDLARKCKSEPGNISPRVGAIVVRDSRILGEAFRGELAPGEHAEFTLLEGKLADQTLAGATLFTTLEPCTSRNHPKIACADRIVERRIKRVVIGVLDPNHRIRGLGELSLRAAGIEIARFDADLMSEIEELNRDFARQHPTGVRRRRTKAQTTAPVKPCMYFLTRQLRSHENGNHTGPAQRSNSVRLEKPTRDFQPFRFHAVVLFRRAPL